MTTQKPQENLTSGELLDKVKQALTPEQYSRMHDKAIEKVGIMRLASMNLDELKSEMPNIIAGDQEEHDIMIRLSSVFPGEMKSPQAKLPELRASKDSPVKFTEHPWEYVKQKTSEAGDWMYEHIVPDRFKEIREATNKGSSTKVVAATALGGTTAGEIVATAERAMNWWNKLQKDPIAWFKELFDALLSFDFKKITGFFSSTLDDVGLSTDIVKKFAEKWLPASMLKTAESIFSIKNFTDMEFGKVEKIWKIYQKNGDTEPLLKLGIPEDKVKNALPILDKMLSKNSKESIIKSLGENVKLEDMKIGDIIKDITLS